MATENIDRKAMLAAGKLLKNSAVQANRSIVENLATKGLGVVLEQGLYAGLLFFYSRPDRERSIANLFATMLLLLTKELVPPPEKSGVDWNNRLSTLGYIATDVTKNLQQTIWVKTVWEQTLTYVRYGAKALEKAGD